MPQTEIRADVLNYLCVGLSKAGYGSMYSLKKYSSEDFFNLLWYERFINDYQAEMMALNKRG